MTIALDIGASGLRSMRVNGERLAARCARTIYSVVDDTPARRQMLEQLGIIYAICEGSIAIPGDSARDLSELFHAPVLPLLPNGRLPDGDPPARQMLAALIEAVLPDPVVKSEICTLTLPGMAGGARERDSETARFLMQLVRLRGFEPKIVSPGTALVLAELVQEGFTGIGISFGAAACHVSLVNRGGEIASCSVDHAGTWIDEQLASESGQYIWDAQGRKYLDSDTVARWKTSNAARLDDVGSTDREQSLSRLYGELLKQIAMTAGDAFRETLLLPGSWPAMTVIACGGPTRIRGFVPCLAKSIREADWPVRVKQIRLAEDSDLTIARGCLISAELEARTIEAETALHAAA